MRGEGKDIGDCIYYCSMVSDYLLLLLLYASSIYDIVLNLFCYILKLVSAMYS